MVWIIKSIALMSQRETKDINLLGKQSLIFVLFHQLDQVAVNVLNLQFYEITFAQLDYIPIQIYSS